MIALIELHRLHASLRGDPGVPRRAIQRPRGRARRQLPTQRVLATAPAHDEHVRLLPARAHHRALGRVRDDDRPSARPRASPPERSRRPRAPSRASRAISRAAHRPHSRAPRARTARHRTRRHRSRHLRRSLARVDALTDANRARPERVASSRARSGANCPSARRLSSSRRPSSADARASTRVRRRSSPWTFRRRARFATRASRRRARDGRRARGRETDGG